MKEKTSLFSLQTLGYLTWLLVWTAVQTFILYRLGFSWKISLTDALVSNFLLLADGIAAININRFYQPASRSYLYRIPLMLALAGLCVLASTKVLPMIFPEEKTYQLFLVESLPVRFAFSLLAIAFFSLLSVIMKKNREEQESQKRKTHTEQLFRDAELARLRQQLHPHFLFNSLNSISALVGSRPDEARKMIQQLSDFLRGTLRKDDQQLVSLEEELSLLQLYMDIEKVRFSHRLSTPVNSTEESLPLLLPPLLLQPIVENAIKFGLYDTTEAVSIRISTRKEKGMLFIEIENPFDPSTAKPKKGAGFGLDSVRKRLFLLYGRADLLTTEQKGAQFFTYLKIPQSNA